MSTLDPARIDFLRTQGLSYTEIGAELETKDAARGSGERYLTRRAFSARATDTPAVSPGDPGDSAGGVSVSSAVRPEGSSGTGGSEGAVAGPRVRDRRAYRKAYNKAHREEKLAYDKAYNKAYYAAHREEKLAYERARREEKSAYDKAHYAAHREEKLAYNKAHYEAHREEKLAYERARRMAEAVEYLRSGSKSYLDGVIGNRLTRQQKLEAMAAQSASPHEALIAKQKLEGLYG